MSEAVIVNTHIERPKTTHPNNTRSDPFNWPTLNRADLMSNMSVINTQQDAVQTKIENYRPRTRDASSNLLTSDV